VKAEEMPGDATPTLYDDQRGYRPGVGIMLVDSAGRVLVARRIDKAAEAWQMPQGGIDAGETPEEAALRELEEEVGTRKAEIVAESDWLPYDLPEELRDKLWGGRYRGQRQKWFLCRFTGDDRDILLDRHVHPEFNAWRWVEPAELPALIVPFKRALYERVLAEFHDHLVNWRAAADIPHRR
jgi:putative (di)nucleoside polyphosphate hydrolase